MTLWLPPREANRLQGERQRYVAGLLQQRELHAEVERWNGILKEIDPALELVRAPENATHAALKPGYWHVIRHDSGEMPPGVVVHEGPNGEYLDPDSSLLERLRAGDMWSNRSMKAVSDRDRKAQAAAERAREREREERIDEVMDRAKAAWNPGTLIPKDIP